MDKTLGDLAVAEVQKRLDEAGVKDLRFYWKENLKADVQSGKVPKEQIQLDVAHMLTQYLDGNVVEMDMLEDETFVPKSDLSPEIETLIDNVRI